MFQARLKVDTSQISHHNLLGYARHSNPHTHFFIILDTSIIFMLSILSRQIPSIEKSRAASGAGLPVVSIQFLFMKKSIGSLYMNLLFLAHFKK
jgi:hypothetical protein